jgi:hypothetical protein
MPYTSRVYMQSQKEKDVLLCCSETFRSVTQQSVKRLMFHNLRITSWPVASVQNF